jgi:hypothetical protein
MNAALLQQPFIQITLPIVIGVVAIGVWQNRRLDDIIGWLSRIETRLDRIEKKLDDHSERIVLVEERTALVR